MLERIKRFALRVGRPQRVTTQHGTQIPERGIDPRRRILHVRHRVEHPDRGGPQPRVLGTDHVIHTTAAGSPPYRPAPPGPPASLTYAAAWDRPPLIHSLVPTSTGCAPASLNLAPQGCREGLDLFELGSNLRCDGDETLVSGDETAGLGRIPWTVSLVL